MVQASLVHQRLHPGELAQAVRHLDCDPALADTAAFCEHYGVPVEQSANTILVAGKPRGAAPGWDGVGTRGIPVPG